MKTRTIQSLQNEFPHWDTALRQCHYSWSNPDELDDKTREDASLKFLKILATILHFFAKHSSVRDSWETPKANIYPFGLAGILHSAKQSAEYEFGLYKNEFYLHSYITYPQNIKHMPDSFWKHMMDLDQYGNFSFQANASPIYSSTGAPKKELRRSAGSNIYKMIRNCIFLEQWSDDVVDLGWLELTWPCNTGWETLLLNGSHAFKRIHRLNYMLWRYHYQQVNARMRQRKT